MGIGKFLGQVPAGIESYIYEKNIRLEGQNSSWYFTQDDLDHVCQSYWQRHPIQKVILSRAGIATGVLALLIGAGAYNRVVYHSVEEPVSVVRFDSVVQFEHEHDAEVLKQARLTYGL